MMCLLYYRKWLVGVHSSLCLPVGPVVGISVASLPVCLQRLKISIRDLHHVLEGRYFEVGPHQQFSCSLAHSFPALHNLYSSKITLEYQLPSSSQKLNTTNECIVSVLSGLTLTTLQVYS